MPAGRTYETLASVTLSAATATVVVMSSIPSTYTDLILVINGTNADSSTTNLGIQFNSDTGTNTNYSATRILGDGSTATSSRNANSAYAMIGDINNAIFTSIIHIMNYANTTTFKTVLSRTGNASAYLGAYVGIWRKSPAEAITSITILKNGGGNFNIGCEFALYGVKAA